ncbi:MAG: class I adenylate-forming enzyme family protein [Thermoanaerobaculia bacterium]|nr:class I adenylate-forming enzyme family protein [Thermoanaerobaculia bacterium]
MIYEAWRRAAEDGSRLAVVDGDRRLTAAELSRRCERLASVLATGVGLERGDRVLLLAPNCLETASALLAVARQGAVLVPVSAELRDPEVAHYVERFRPRAVLTLEALTDRWPGALGEIAPERIVRLDRMPEDVAPPPPREPVAGEAFLVSTSGTTGVPKVVAWTARGTLRTRLAVYERLGIGAGDRVLGVVPVQHAYGLGNSFVGPLVTGATVVLSDRFLPRRVLDLVERERITALIGSPFIFSAVADCVDDPARLASVRVWLSAGAKLPDSVRETYAGFGGIRFRELYGNTEVGSVAIQDADTEDRGFRVLETAALRIVDDEGRDLAPGAEGEVVVQTEGMADGYVGEAKRSPDSWYGDWWRTGDLGRLDPEGRLLLTGRMTRRLNIAGIKVDPVEVETVLRSIPGVEGARVKGVEGRRGVDSIHATVLVAEGVELSRQDVIAHCRDRLAEYKLPRTVDIVDSMPVDPLGKSRL